MVILSVVAVMAYKCRSRFGDDFVSELREFKGASCTLLLVERASASIADRESNLR